ncbi:hypothetical protein BCV53_13955 [Parageobacillus thermoglucosidasius]|uniref:Uncharacterized protein n=1 Tax=Parageobacillus thermoglucosidasius TaxID=1426 RepID=A0AAN0YPM2_PARTM|nr:hypothetical protein AOT13_13940 [Parageobacillus thermoglucosidasius]REK53866.1 MAG: hypothetical protein C6P36_16030 [Geobacillus sp.]ANZ31100.1 hypothetical protein BCV53_13955 [Parageobacillus thermoglucosidasius]APM81837.1 hypothetical protein BCV54_13965 [Parageobacillus thermoglucosidasius]KJX67460.1 hypothetical protein WH82_17480 [Parageobacillus thermoglucosidasius]
MTWRKAMREQGGFIDTKKRLYEASFSLLFHALKRFPLFLTHISSRFACHLEDRANGKSAQMAILIFSLKYFRHRRLAMRLSQ